MQKQDLVDTVLAQWHKERPDIDPAPMAVMGRLIRTDAIFSKELHTVFSRFGLNGGEFDVLATLRRSGKPYTLTPNQLLQTLMLTSGSMTNRIDKLENKGLVTRNPDPNDRRGVMVAITEQGLTLIDEVISEHVAKGEELLSPLASEERTQLADLLRKLLVHFNH
ncbi:MULTISPECIES: MarR family transcriptional regulator [unclassified Pseudoalteromonas]|uniref:MarR family winged helix-turn-helix transcriptional regulator n=1 Tax=unclassified Pseudoalteromonas TaxID=194690 RepID=UPI0020975BDF|nr:MarR family transcriptional regulator [Pseudoalteromonas sp. XMcav2-N]MCO7190923.1 MarR family transcriptional regulator [Pseudoalteromonas sp. XMcav2-N]